MNELQELLEKHEKIPFPGFPVDDNFSEWVEELIEIDGYYVGLINSIANSSQKKIDESHFMRIKDKLKQFPSIEEDKDIFEKFFAYLNSLEQLIKLSKKQLKF